MKGRETYQCLAPDILNICLGWEGALKVVARRVRNARLGKNIDARPERGIKLFPSSEPS
jgi:hypothetical protein